jgi:hypothetical protein
MLFDVTSPKDFYIISINEIRVITKLPHSEQSYKGKVKTHKYINRQNQSTQILNISASVTLTFDRENQKGSKYSYLHVFFNSHQLNNVDLRLYTQK